MQKILFLFIMALALLCAPLIAFAEEAQPMPKMPVDKEALKAKLSPEQYHVTQEKGTERPFTGKYVHFDGKGTYVCPVCGQALFSSESKFDSGSGWPSFTEPAAPGSVETKQDNSYGMARTEVVCSKCGAHLGHVFDDGPQGKPRFCINSLSLEFQGEDGKKPQE